MMEVKKTVWVVYPDRATREMFEELGYNVLCTTTDKWPETIFDFICFTGGSDVHPSFYGEEINGARGFDVTRDIRETQIFHRALKEKIPMVGICRGGQLLNVMMGGSMIQDLGTTISGIVEAIDSMDLSDFYLHVDHHQGMEARTGFGDVLVNFEYSRSQMEYCDYVIVYKVNKVICFQPHPEWGHEPTKNYFAGLIEENL